MPIPIVWFVLLGAAIGSFLNVCIDRLPAGQSLLGPPSHCPGCSKAIKAADLIPVVSYLWLRGRCRYCQARIPLRVLLVELCTALLFALLWWHYGPGWQLAMATVYSCFLLVITVIDLEHGLILDAVSYPAMGVSAIFAFFWPDLGIARALIGGGVAFAIIALIILLSRTGMGWGDSKMASFIGLMTGFPLSIMALILSFLSGGLVGALLLASGRKGRKDTVPFGPFLAVGAWVTLLFGPSLIDWYWRLMGVPQ